MRSGDPDPAGSGAIFGQLVDKKGNPISKVNSIESVLQTEMSSLHNFNSRITICWHLHGQEYSAFLNDLFFYKCCKEPLFTLVPLAFCRKKIEGRLLQVERHPKLQPIILILQSSLALGASFQCSDSLYASIVVPEVGCLLWISNTTILLVWIGSLTERLSFIHQDSSFVGK